MAGTRLKSVTSYIYPQGDSVCIECYFTTETSTDSCVAIIHQNITHLNSTDGLLKISSVYQINRTNGSETASACIPGINLYDYQIGVIPLIYLNEEDSMAPMDSEGIYANNLSNKCHAVRPDYMHNFILISVPSSDLPLVGIIAGSGM